MRLYLLWCFIIFPFYVVAEDIIVFNSGDIVKATVTEIGQNEVKYKKSSNPQGPTYSVDKSRILSITYENGDIDKFSENDNNNRSVALANENTPLCVESIADNENRSIKKASNIILSPSSFKLRKKKAKNGIPVMWIDDKSVISTEDISMRIVGAVCPSKYNCYVMRYYIEINNKSNSTIYVDKASSFKINDQGLAMSFYDNKSISINRGSGSGMSIGLGGITNSLGIGGIVGNIANGISVGGGQSYGASTTYNNQRVLIIPPHGKTYISEHKYEHIGGSSWNLEMISDAESFMVDVKPLNLYDGELREYDEISSPYKVNYIIAFSMDPSFSKYSILNAGLYAKYILCKSVQLPTLKYIPSYPEAFKSQSDALNTYSKVIPDFENLFGSIIIGRDYRED